MTVVVLFLWLGVCPVLSSVWRHFRHITEPMTWHDAQQHCKNEYASDLATVVTSSDMQSVSLKRFEAWIGLKKNSHWHWVDANWRDINDIKKVFAKNEPVNGQDCGKVVYTNPQAYSDDCSQKHFVICDGPSYSFLPVAKTWAEGQDYCRKKSWEYMTFPNNAKFLFNETSAYVERDFPVWIGLHDNSGAWGWSDETRSNYRTWDSGSDPGSSPGSCVAVSSQSRKMTVKSCDELYPFICYYHTLVLVRELLTWEQGLEKCRRLSSSSSYKMLSVEEDELVYIKSLTTEATTTKLWVGLRFLNGYWFWTDGSPVTLSSLPSLSSLPLCPTENTLRCGVMDRSTSSIIPFDCSQKFNVLCYKAVY